MYRPASYHHFSNFPSALNRQNERTIDMDAADRICPYCEGPKSKYARKCVDCTSDDDK